MSKDTLSFSERLQLWSAEARLLDGLWIGVSNVTDHSSADILDRVESALKVIRTYDPWRYRRLLQQLQRVWVKLQISRSLGSYNSTLRACNLDLRYVLRHDVGAADIASTIVHEATHARLHRFGYSETIRGRIEALCRNQERAFADHLPQAEGDKIRAKLERWKTAKDDWWSDATLNEDYEAGIGEALRYMRVPKWLVPVIILSRGAVIGIRRFARIISGRRAA